MVIFGLFPHLRQLIIRLRFHFVGTSPSLPASSQVLNPYRQCGFLHHVTLPALEHLGVTIWNTQGSHAIVSFLARSKFSTLEIIELLVLEQRPRRNFLPGVVPYLIYAYYPSFPHKLTARLRIISAQPIPPPTKNVLSRFHRLTVADMHITLETPTYRWPETAPNQMDGDYNIFSPDDSLPFYKFLIAGVAHPPVASFSPPYFLL
ncbi:hypothetical protein DFH08DRAFT_1088922 [Mycena albidolilacea]|uniref:Uncharacterized protein n=1 Tax=Mycena albidolilacea TaxID=1033008 RepID=A0AAD7EAK9_9AGAR|nr:hypothetical protein DFH08DRAFT_1088922 [Mycena albidolilacea]